MALTSGDWEENVLIVPALSWSPFWKTTSGGFLWEMGETIGGARSVEKIRLEGIQQALGCTKMVKLLIRPRSSKRMQYLRASAGI